jgi:hypothetical protein
MMDRATLERLARDAGLDVVGGVIVDVTVGRLSRFAMHVAEECAQACEAVKEACPPLGSDGDLYEGGAEDCATAIRARFGPPP